MILKTILPEPKHGWAIAKRLQQISGEVQVQQGSRYLALHRLEQKAWIKAKWAESETGRKAKFYSLTAAGRAQLEKEAKSWESAICGDQHCGAGKLVAVSHDLASTIVAAVAESGSSQPK